VADFGLKAVALEDIFMELVEGAKQ